MAVVAKSIRDYYERLNKFEELQASHEGATREAFQVLLGEWGKPHGLTLISEKTIEVAGKQKIRPDGILMDNLLVRRGYWEAKDTADNLEREIEKKKAAHYILTNTLFENTRQAVLYQDNKRRLVCEDMRDPASLKELLDTFVHYTTPNYESYHQAVNGFREAVPSLAEGLTKLIEAELKRRGSSFKVAFERFLEHCRSSLNPDTTPAQVEDMLKQHILTERIFRSIFQNHDFVQRNPVAVELEKVLKALTGEHFSRDDFSRNLDKYYRPIEETARTITDYHEKQDLLNGLYERFFQAYSKRTADTHGIVYTPQPLVRWMVASVEKVLQSEFGQDLGSTGVHIIDPCVGTGNFIMELLRKLPTTELAHKYAHELHANEIQLLPYYIAAQNIEHAYYERMGKYAQFEGLCFTDTLDIIKDNQMKFDFAEENSERVKRQQTAPITVVIGNPPYNAKQDSENDNNKNRKYAAKNKETIDSRVARTYAAASQATNKNALSDPYVKFFRWATDRLEGRDGVICFVSNNSFIDQIAFDGMRKHLLQDFTHVYVFDLGGNVRKNPKLSGTKHNVFGIQVGVAVTLLVRNQKYPKPSVFYTRFNENWTKAQKLAELGRLEDYTQTVWQELTPDNRGTWLTENLSVDFEALLPMGTKEVKSGASNGLGTIFKVYSQGTQTNLDDWLYDFDAGELTQKVKRFIETYNSEVDRWKRRDEDVKLDDFLIYDDKRIKWTSSLKSKLTQGKQAKFDRLTIRHSLYRPFSKQYLYFNNELVHRMGKFPNIFPTPETEQENNVISLTGTGWSGPFYVLVSNLISNVQLAGNVQCFPFYTYDEDGGNRRENITDWALEKFRTQYDEVGISKRDIFYYTYAVLHAPTYRTMFAENLKRDLPRIPFVANLETFQAYVVAGTRLADLHQNYQSVTPYRLRSVENKDVAMDWQVDERGMRLSPDKTDLRYNHWLTLQGIPAKVFEYRLGNRSALEWVIDQYTVTHDARSGLTHDPNEPSDRQAIVKLVGQVITVSLETLAIIEGLPSL